MNWTWYLFGFKGRINRAKYWLAGLIIVAFMLVFAGLAVGTGIVADGGRISFNLEDVFYLIDPAAWRALSLAKLPLLLVKVVGTALFVWIFAATSVKRLHDRDRSGWWAVPFFVVPGFYSHFAERLPDSWLVLPLALIAFVLCVWGFVELYFLSGSRKTNRFGPNPLLAVHTEKRWEQHSEIEMVPHKAGPPPIWRVKPGA